MPRSTTAQIPYQVTSTKNPDISREQHGGQVNIRQGKLRKVTQNITVYRPGFQNSRLTISMHLVPQV